MITRRAAVDVTYNGTSITSKLSPYVTGITYTDPASGEADSLDINVHDRDSRWIGAWFPSAGDILTATIHTLSWGGVSGALNCGIFIVDNFSFNGWPTSGTISGVSVPVDSCFRETARTKNWEDVTIEEIGKEIASRAGISLMWDVEGEPFKLTNVEQSQQTDCEFYMALCEKYGLSMKVYSNKIVVYDREAYKRKGSVATLAPNDILSWSWSSNTAKTYTGGEFTYTDPNTEEEIKVNVGDGNRILKESGKADNVADAERQIQAAISNANHGMVKLSATIMGNATFVASQCVGITGLGRLSGKYFIDNITHNIGSSGYTMDMELSLVQ